MFRVVSQKVFPFIKNLHGVENPAIKGSIVKSIPKGALLIAMYGATIGRIAELGVKGTNIQMQLYHEIETLPLDAQKKKY